MGTRVRRPMCRKPIPVAKPAPVVKEELNKIPEPPKPAPEPVPEPKQETVSEESKNPMERRLHGRRGKRIEDSTESND